MMAIVARTLRWKPVAATGVAALAITSLATLTAPYPAAAEVANPEIPDSCGLDVTVVLDASGSVQSSGAVGDVRAAADDFLTSLSGTNSNARVTQFATFSEELAPVTLIDAASLGQGGALRAAINGYYNPRPPQPAGVNLYEYRGGDPQSANSWRSRSGSSYAQYTNWDQGLDDGGRATSDLVVFVTDGDPTAYDFNQPGDPFDAGPPPDVGFRTDRGRAEATTLARAVEEADGIKTTGTRMLAIGVGAAVTDPTSPSAARLAAISGPQIVTDQDLDSVTSINDIDVALVRDFDKLQTVLRGIVLELCSPSLTIRKLAQTPGDATYQPAPGWDMTVTPTVPGGTFGWILPDTAPAAAKTVATGPDGFAQFQWEPDPPEADSQALVSEQLQPGYTAGRPGDTDYRCELRNEAGETRIVEGELTTVNGTAQFTLDPIGQEIVTCNVYNSFDYQPAIALTKTNTPTELRGDLTPPARVTSEYTVTNPGNTPLTIRSLGDDRCTPVTPVVQPGGTLNIGDLNGDGLLDPGEAWRFLCARGITTAASTDPAGTKIVNTATVIGIDPTGTQVEATATDDVDAFNPAIEITKLVDGQKETTVEQGSTVTYTFDVRNTGNTPLGAITLTDVAIPDNGCTPAYDSGDDGDGILALTETWRYTCTATIQQGTRNTVTVEGTPLNPVQNNQPFPEPNPTVTDNDAATVVTVLPGLLLTKTVDRDVVFPGTPVTYSYTAENTGDVALRNDTGDPGWVTDDTCAPVQQVVQAGFNVGDANQDGLLDPGEVWQFTCTTTIDGPTINIATIVAQPIDNDGNPILTPITRTAQAFVNIVLPGISVEKTAVKDVVLDATPQQPPFSGPDVPDSRPAEYTYAVGNPGDVPLRGVTLTDDTCAPVTFVDGDTNGDGFLDPTEVWTYSCTTQLERSQGTPPPNGPESAFVRNVATVEGTPFLPSDPTQTAPVQTATDDAAVLVIEPGLTITKTASADVVLAGSEVTYTVEVSNAGDVGLELQGPEDDRCAPLVYQSGDANNNGLLDGANSDAPETWTYTCTRTLDLPTPPDTSVVNTATVRGIDPLGNQYRVSDSAEVRVISPAIDLVKSVDAALVPTGTTVTYTFEVSNIGASPLASDDILAQILLVDASEPPVPACERPTYVSGDTNGDDLLPRDPSETWIYTCSAEITEPTTDVAGVRGTAGTLLQPPLLVDVFAFDAQFVQPFNPAIEVVKSAEPTELLGAGAVTYTYEVRNTGDVPLSDVAERITDDTCDPVTYLSGDEDGDGLLDSPISIFEDSGDEVWVFTCTTTVTETTVNTVTVTGTPTDPGGVGLCGAGAEGRVGEPCDVTDTDNERVVVTQPGTIIIAKQAEPADGTAFDFTLGEQTFSLQDGESATFEGLAPGQYPAGEAGPDGWSLDDLTCEDPSGGTTADVAAGTAVIDLAEGETVTCTFTNEQVPPTMPETPETGAGGWFVTMAFGLALLAAGVLLTGAARGRRGRAG